VAVGAGVGVDVGVGLVPLPEARTKWVVLMKLILVMLLATGSPVTVA
jgi:hypothetical protein